MLRRDAWVDVTTELLARLRDRRAAIPAKGAALKEEFERRFAVLRDEHSALKTEIVALEEALEVHVARTAQLALAAAPANVRVLPAPVELPRHVVGGKVDTMVGLIKAWVRDHDGELRTGPFVAALIEQGHYRSKPSAFNDITSALVQIGRGFEKERLGLYRFYAIDGVAIGEPR